MATFPTIKTFSSLRIKKDSKVIRANFGDGYEQVAKSGINSTTPTLTLEWDFISGEDFVLLSDFIDQVSAVESFTITDPLTDVVYTVRYVENTFNATATNDNYHNVTIDVKKVYGV